MSLLYKILYFFHKVKYKRKTITDYYNEDGMPIKCKFCDSTELEDEVEERLDYTASRYAVVCTQCHAEVGYWAYGYFNPMYMEDMEEQ